MSLGGCDNFCGSFGVVNALQSNLPYKRPPKQRRLSGRLIREVIRLLEPNYRESLPRICPVPHGGEVSERKSVVQSACQYDVTSRVSDFQNGEQSVHRRDG